MKTLYLSFITLLLLCSCGGTRHSSTAGWSNEQFSADKGAFEESPQKNTGRVLIYNATITLCVRSSDSTNSSLTRVAAKYGGYVQSLGTERSVIRVKASLLAQALNEICSGGKLKKKSIYGDDVTEEYEDSRIRLDNSYKARQRYLELLAKAENVEAALKVEKELERLNKEIDVLEGRIRRLQHLSEYSTITVSIEKKAKPGILGYVFIGLYKGVKWLFVRN